MKQFYYTLSVSFLFLFCSQFVNAQTIPKTKEHQYTSTIFQNPDHTFGYTILDKGKKYIHQPTIPGRAGTNGFKTKKDAQKVATFVMTKMDKGIFPPSVSEEELKTLHIAK